MPHRQSPAAPEASGRSSTLAVRTDVRAVRTDVLTARRASFRSLNLLAAGVPGGRIRPPLGLSARQQPSGKTKHKMNGIARIACLVAGILAVALAGSSAKAWAGTYTQYTCKLPDGTPAATDGWVSQTAAFGFAQSDACVAGESLHTQMLGIGMGVGSQRYWRWTAAPNTSVQAVEIRRSFALAPGDTTATPTMSIAAGSQLIEQNGSSLPAANGIAVLGNPTTWNSSANLVSVSDPASLVANQLTVALRCTGVSTAACP